MNRRSFLAALGAAATQQRFGPHKQERSADTVNEPVIVTTTRFPYMQNVQDDKASILWATVQAGTGQVAYSSDGINFDFAPAKSRSFARAETGLATDIVQYQADLTELTPNTDYVYRVSVGGHEIGSPSEPRFRTAGPGPFKFIVLGDSGWGDENQARVAQKVAAEKAAMVIHTGDIVYPRGSYEFYQRNYFNFYATTMASTPFFPSPGNHDYEIPNATPYLTIHAVPTETVPAADRGRYYSYDWGNVHFVSLDAHQCLDRAVNGSGAMLRWLENDLRSTRQFWRIAYFHYPPFATGQNTNDPQATWARQYLVPILENNGVQIVFSGHEHSYQRIRPMRKSRFLTNPGLGTSYLTSGGGGAVLYAAPDIPMIAFAKSAFHYVRVNVQQTSINIRCVRFDGVEIDNYTISPPPLFSDDPKQIPISLSPGPVAGGIIRISGRGLAAEESFACTPIPASEMAGTVVTVNGRPIELLYVSPTQIYGRLPFPVEGNMTVTITTANGSIERAL